MPDRDREDESNGNAAPQRRRERSNRYPGVDLAESLKLCEAIDGLGVDGTSAAAIASALGYSNIKTNTFSARLSAARQFGLLALSDDGYALTPLARSILHPVDPDDVPSLHRQALLKPPLYAELAARLGGKRVPDATILGNILYHNHQIISSAKQAAAEAFLDSARFSGVIDGAGIFHPEGVSSARPAARPEPSAPAAPAPVTPTAAPPAPASRPAPARRAPIGGPEVRLDLQLWDDDAGKQIRVRAPQTITPASYERFLQAFRLLVRVEEADAADDDA